MCIYWIVPVSVMSLWHKKQAIFKQQIKTLFLLKSCSLLTVPSLMQQSVTLIHTLLHNTVVVMRIRCY
jgi:hypothetical protein